MKVEIKDREKQTEYLRMALNTVGIGVDYTTTNLILRMQEGLNKKKGKFTLKDAFDVQAKWEDYWREYDRLREETELVLKNNNK